MFRKTFFRLPIMILIVSLGLFLIPMSVSADENVQLFPVDDGTIWDYDPFDGVGDVVDHDEAILASLNTGIIEFRGAMEFDLSSITTNNTIESAFLYVTPIGRAVPPNTSTIPIQLFGYLGDGTVGTDDFNAGRADAVRGSRACPSYPAAHTRAATNTPE